MTEALGLLVFVLALGAVARPLSRRARAAVLLLGLGLPIALALPVLGDPDQPLPLGDVAYETSTACLRCHPDHTASWERSFHRSMTREATPETVKGDFDDASATFFGVTTRMYRVGDQFFFETIDPVWLEDARKRGVDLATATPPTIELRVDLTIGSHNYQQYASRAPSGLILRLPLAWHIGMQRWIHMNGAFLQPDNDDFHHHAAVWNVSCIFCHNVKARPRLGSEAGRAILVDKLGEVTYDTQVEELGVACEACHGPGDEHIAKQTNVARRYLYAARSEPDPTIVNPARLTKERSAQVCGHCHTVRVFHRQVHDELYFGGGDPYTAGENLDAYVHVQRPDDFKDGHGISRRWNYWPDGTMKRTSIEYVGLVTSPCYERGEMTCLSCHQMHAEDPVDQLGPGMRTNLACTRCHDDYASPAAQAAHSHHAPDSPGNLCYNCHMPNVTWGLLRGMRTHRVITPRVADAAASGMPHACNQCHLDRTLAWTAEVAGRWYGEAATDLAGDERATVLSLVHLLRGDAVQRALAAWTFGWEEARQASDVHWAPPFLLTALADDYPAVRLAGFRSLRTFPGLESIDFDYLGTPEARAGQMARIGDRIAALEAQRAAELAGGIEILPGGMVSGVPDAEGTRDLLARQDGSEMFIEE